jgi:hypothetical protein
MSSGWGTRGAGRKGAARLRLLGALRGTGQLTWTGGPVPVAYEINVFGAGDVRSASGSLEGNFPGADGFDPSDPQASPAPDARLRLEDGTEVAVDITSLEPEVAEFDVRRPAQLNGLIAAHLG